MRHLGVLLAALLGVNSAHVVDLNRPLHWMAPFFSGGGYCSEAISFVTSIDKYSNMPVSIGHHGDSISQSFVHGLPKDTRNALHQMAYRVTDLQSDQIVVCHSEPGAWHPARYQTSRCPPAVHAYSIGRTMFETDRLPDGWADRLNKMDEVWVPTVFHRDIFTRGGVESDKLHVVPEAVDTEYFDPDHIEANDADAYSVMPVLTEFSDHSATRFLSVFKWEYRKGWDVLFETYLSAFTAEDQVVLVVLTDSYHGSDQFQAQLEAFIVEKWSIFASTTDEPADSIPSPQRIQAVLAALPPVRFVSRIPQALLVWLYDWADAVVLPTRGEGWGRPHVEAMSMAKPVIATNWSGPTAYLTDDNGYPLQYDELRPIPSGAFQGHLMAEPSIAHLKELLLHVVADPDAAKAKGTAARATMLQHYRPEVVAALVLDRLVAIDRVLRDEAEL